MAFVNVSKSSHHHLIQCTAALGFIVVVVVLVVLMRAFASCRAPRGFWGRASTSTTRHLVKK
jgi:hypothetical protein